MNDHTRLDSQVRGALAELPMPDEAQTRIALSDVLRRSHTERTHSRWLAPVLVAAAVVTILTLAGTFLRLPHRAEPAPAQSPSSQVRGEWQRDVTGTQQPEWNGTWSMTFASEGVLLLHGPSSADASSDGASYALTTKSMVRVDVFVNSACSELPAGRYAWSRTDDVLTLTLVEDPCPVRARLLAGPWLRP